MKKKALKKTVRYHGVTLKLNSTKDGYDAPRTSPVQLSVWLSLDGEGWKTAVQAGAVDIMGEGTTIQQALDSALGSAEESLMEQIMELCVQYTALRQLRAGRP